MQLFLSPVELFLLQIKIRVFSPTKHRDGERFPNDCNNFDQCILDPKIKDDILTLRLFSFLLERANSLKRLSKVCLILGETVKSADLADRALQIYKQTHGDTMEHREVSQKTLHSW